MKPLEIGIIGAGTAGSAAALFLSRDGHKVTLFERVSEPRAIGAGIVLQPSGMSVLAALGLLPAAFSIAPALRAITLAALLWLLCHQSRVEGIASREAAVGQDRRTA